MNVYRVLGCKTAGRRKTDDWVEWQSNVPEIVAPGAAFDSFQTVVYLEDETVVAAFVRRPAQWIRSDMPHRMAVRESGDA